MKSPNPGDNGGVSLVGVSCPTATSCFAAGFVYSRGSPSKVTSVVEHWNGHTWSMMKSPNPTGATNTWVRGGPSCASATSCFIVGEYQTVGHGDRLTMLVEHWDGHTWSVMSSPNPTGALQSGLQGVACASATSCSAVGWYFTKTDMPVLVEHWNGHRWSVMTTPKPTQSSLDAVSCPTTTSCFAVGHANGTLIEHWDGHRWSIMTNPNPAGSVYPLMFGVSCASTTSCFAVGHANGTLVEHWDGHRWSIMSSPKPPSGGDLLGVSCPTTRYCIAVGTSSGSLTERYA